MKYIIAWVFLLLNLTLNAQSNTDLFLVAMNDGKLQVTNPMNISNNEGYDNQPSFFDDHNILFSSTRNRQTDIAKYDTTTGSTQWISDTPGGSEYSPTKVPNREAVSTIRLDTTGLQRLYAYTLGKGRSKEPISDLKVGYHLWYSPQILVVTVLIEDRMDLVITDLHKMSHKTIQKNVGRSLQKIPNTNLVSFVKKGNKAPTLMSLDPISGETKKIITLTGKSEDICWLNNGAVLCGYGKSILQFNPLTDTNWKEIARFTDQNINNISRLAVNAANTKLVLVAEASPVAIVEKQVEAFNSGNLDAFVSCYTDNVLVQNFPNDTLYVGKINMKANYRRYLAENPDTKVKVEKRIAIGEMVIDEELATVSGRSNQQVAIYEVTNGKIGRMTFIHDNSLEPDAEVVVQEQLDAYNSRNIEAFISTYAEHIQMYDFPNRPSLEGIDKLYDSYAAFFGSTPDLNCEIKNRIVIGNKVIDDEFVTMNGLTYHAVVIYELENGKIVKVTFLK